MIFSPYGIAVFCLRMGLVSAYESKDYAYNFFLMFGWSYETGPGDGTSMVISMDGIHLAYPSQFGFCPGWLNHWLLGDVEVNRKCKLWTHDMGRSRDEFL